MSKKFTVPTIPPDVMDKIRACAALRHNSDPDTIGILFQFANDSDERVRGNAFLVLGWRRVPEAISLLVDRLHCEESPSLKRVCAQALEHYDNDQSCEALIGALADASPAVARQAVLSLTRNHSSKADNALRIVLQTGSWTMRLYACLGFMKKDIIFPELLTALEQLYESPERIAYDAQWASSIASGDTDGYIDILERIERVRRELTK